MDDRGVSIGILSFFGSLVAGGIIYYLAVVKFGSELNTRFSAEASGAVSTDANTWLWTAGETLIPLTFLVVGTFGLLAYAVYLREVSP